MRRKVISLFLALVVVCIVLSCKAEVLKDGENINNLVYPYLEFTLSEDGSYYTAEVIENVRLERVEIPEAVDNLGSSIPVLYFNGFKRADDSSSLKTLVLSTSKTRVTSSALKNASSFNKLEIKKIDGSATIPELPVIEKDGKEFLGWFIPGTDTKVSSGDTISLSSLSIEPRWKDHSLVYHEGKKATCTEDGWTEYYTCKTCSYNTKKIIPKLGHKLFHHEEIKATCTESGTRDYYECTRCEKYFSDSEGIYEISKIVIPALTHNLSIHKEKEEANCIKEGHREYWQCERCKEYFLSSDLASSPVKESEIVLPKADHTYSTKWSHDTNNHYHVCSVCGAIEESSLKEHTFTEETFDPTETESGKTVYTCSTCSYFYVVPIHPNGHLYDENSKVEIHMPTCTEKGFTRKFCSYKGCDYYKDDSFVEPLHHKNAEHHSAKTATCTEDGNYEYWYCPDCGKYFLSGDKIKPIEKEKTIIGKLGHQYGEEWKYDENGHYHECIKCGDKKDTGKHIYDQEIKNTQTKKSDKNCTSPDIYYFSCICGYCPKDDNLTFTYGVALGHSLTIHERRKEPTCIADGNVEYWKCDRCYKFFEDSNATKEIEEKDTILGKTGIHTPSEKYESIGSSGHKEVCSVCSQTFGDTIAHTIKPLGGQDPDRHWDTCEYCDYKENVENHTFVTYGTDEVCSICFYVKDKQHTTGGGFDIKPEIKEPKGKIELVKITDGYKASFILEEGSKMTAIKWFVDEIEIATTRECSFSTPDSRSYRVMCVVFNEDLVTSYSEVVVGGNNN